MLLRHHDIENKNLTFNSWLQIAKKIMIRATTFEQGIQKHSRGHFWNLHAICF